MEARGGHGWGAGVGTVGEGTVMKLVGGRGAFGGVGGGGAFVKEIDGCRGGDGRVDEAFIISNEGGTGCQLMSIWGESGDIRDCGVVKRLKKCLDHAVKLVYSDLFICRVVFQLHSWLLSPCSGFQRSFFQQ